jgi:hypothetical protein
VVADLQHFDEVQDPDPDPDPHQSEVFDPDLHQNKQRDRDPIRITVFWILNTDFN